MPAWSSSGKKLFVFQTPGFSLYSQRAERGSKFSLITCIKALSPFIRSLPSQSHVKSQYLSKTSLPNNMIGGVDRVPIYEFGKRRYTDVQSIEGMFTQLCIIQYES